MVVSSTGSLLGSGSSPLRTWNNEHDQYQQSSADIWEAVSRSVREAVASAGGLPIVGLGFAATCSLVLVPTAGEEVSLSDDDEAQDVIMWMDHRATAEAARASSSRSAALAYLGGAVSPEHQVPKLAWLAKHRPDVMARLAGVMDLCDWLAWTAVGGSDCGSAPRSQCAAVCKWGFVPCGSGLAPCHELYEAAGAASALRLVQPSDGAAPLPVGAPVSEAGLGPKAAVQLGLDPGCVVASGLIDAHAGALASLECGGGSHGRLRMAVVAGTSACLMTLVDAASDSPPLVRGVWGPFWGAVVPGRWLLEGGLSSAGAAIDRLVRSHAAFRTACVEAGAEPPSHDSSSGAPVPAVVYEHLGVIVHRAAEEAGLPDGAQDLLARSIHVCADLGGNRSPYQDPRPLGAVLGLDLAPPDVNDLARLYLAALHGVAHGIALVVHHLAATGGHAVAELVLTGGGLARSLHFRRAVAGACGLPVVCPVGPPAVALGAAVAAAAACG